MGYWWARACTYRRNQKPVVWLNKEACLGENAAQFDLRYGQEPAVFTMPAELAAFAIGEKERQPRALRELNDHDLFPGFLMGERFLALARGVGARGLHTFDCTVSYCGDSQSGGYVLATADVLDAASTLDLSRSGVTMKVYEREGRLSRYITADHAPVHFKADIVDGRDFFFLRGGPSTHTLAISERVAEALFNVRLPGIWLEDTEALCEAPEPYRLYSHEGWREVFPV